jgi:hypothetical protein
MRGGLRTHLPHMLSHTTGVGSKGSRWSTASKVMETKLKTPMGVVVPMTPFKQCCTYGMEYVINLNTIKNYSYIDGRPNFGSIGFVYCYQCH